MANKEQQTTDYGPQKYVIEGFTGGLHSEETTSKVQLADTDCSCANNVEFWPRGTISKRSGRICKNTGKPLSGAITQIYQWYSPAGANTLLICTASSGSCSGDISSFVPSGTQHGTFTFLLSSGQAVWSPETTNLIFIESFAGSAIFVNGKDKMFVWSGTEYCSAASSAPKGAKFIKGYKNYLFLANLEPVGGGTRLSSRVQWSDPSDAHTWPASNFIDLDPNDGDEITGMDILSNELIVFKGSRVYAITYVGGFYEFLAEVRVNGQGCAAGASLGGTYGDITFYDGTGFYAFDGRNAPEFSTKIRDIVLNINPIAREQIFTASYAEKEQLIILVPYLTSETLNQLLVYDYALKAWTIHELAAASLGWYTSEEDLTMGDLEDEYGTYNITWGNRTLLSNAALILAGTYDGYIIETDTSGVQSDIGQDYEGSWRSRWIDFGLPDHNKRITRITFYLDKEVEDASDAYSVWVKIYTDWNALTPLTTKYISVYGTTPVLERRLDMTMHCRALQFEFGTSAKNQPFRVHRIVVEYLPKGRTLV